MDSIWVIYSGHKKMKILYNNLYKLLYIIIHYYDKL